MEEIWSAVEGLYIVKTAGLLVTQVLTLEYSVPNIMRKWWVQICRNKHVDRNREIIMYWLLSPVLWLEAVVLDSLEHQPSSWDTGWNLISSSVSLLSSGNHALATRVDFHSFGALPDLRRNLYCARCCTNQRFYNYDTLISDIWNKKELGWGWEEGQIL